MTDRNEMPFDTFEEDATPNAADVPAIGSVPVHFLDSERVAIYLTLAGLIEAGIDTTTALTLVQTGAIGRDRTNQIDRLTEFFHTVGKARAAVKASTGVEGAVPHDIIGETAEQCFGRNFASSDELVLLRGLAYTDNVPAILKAAAEIVKAKSSIYTPARPAAPAGRRLK
jgi:hypothetical protein